MNNSHDRSISRWLIGAAAVGGAVIAMTNPQHRARAVEVAGKLRDGARDQLIESAERLRSEATRVARIALIPGDATLELARDHVLSEVPEAADTKWRAASLIIRGIAVQLSSGSALASGSAFEAAGRAYAEASAPVTPWDASLMREAVRRIMATLEVESDVRRSAHTVENTVEGCALLESAQSGMTSALCEMVCGTQASLLHGIASHAGWTIASPERLGNGAARCLHVFTTPAEG